MRRFLPSGEETGSLCATLPSLQTPSADLGENGDAAETAAAELQRHVLARVARERPLEQHAEPCIIHRRGIIAEEEC